MLVIPGLATLHGVRVIDPEKSPPINAEKVERVLNPIGIGRVLVFLVVLRGHGTFTGQGAWPDPNRSDQKGRMFTQQ